MKSMFKQILAAYFEPNDYSILDSSQIVNDLGTILGDDIIYGTLKNDDRYLIDYINNYAHKKNLGQIIVNNIYKLINLELKLAECKNVQSKQKQLHYELTSKRDIKKLDENNKKFYNKLINDCDYFLSDMDKITIYDKEMNVSELTDYQKLCIMFEITNSSIIYYHKTCNAVYDFTTKTICKNILGKTDINSKNRSK